MAIFQCFETTLWACPTSKILSMRILTVISHKFQKERQKCVLFQRVEALFCFPLCFLGETIQTSSIEIIEVSELNPYKSLNCEPANPGTFLNDKLRDLKVVAVTWSHRDISKYGISFDQVIPVLNSTFLVLFTNAQKTLSYAMPHTISNYEYSITVGAKW